jgi:hypothetical protein
MSWWWPFRRRPRRVQHGRFMGVDRDGVGTIWPFGSAPPLTVGSHISRRLDRFSEVAYEVSARSGRVTRAWSRR